MASIQVELLTDQGNGAVLRLPGRKFPGVLIQGDTLSNYLSTVGEVLQAFERGDSPEAESIVRELRTSLEELRDRYEAALKNHGIPLPY